MRSSVSTGARRVREHLLEPAPSAAPAARPGSAAAQHRLARRPGRRHPPAEERHGGAVHPHDAAPLVHGDDALGGAVEDRGQERLLARQLLAQLGGPEGDRELVADERQEADAIRRAARRAVRRPQGQEPDDLGAQLAVAQVPPLVERDAVPAVVA